MTALKPAALSCLGGRLQSPELKTRKLDGLFDLRSGKSVWGMLIGLDRTRRSPRSMALRQFASRWITGKCVQVRSCFRSEHIDEHNDAFRNAVLIERRATTRIANKNLVHPKIFLLRRLVSLSS